MNWLEGIKLFGGLAGLASLGWKLYEVFGGYLQLDLSIQDADGVVIADATIENKSVTAKTLDYALLLVGPELEGPVATAQALTRALVSDPQDASRIEQTDDIIRLRAFLTDDKPAYANRSHAILPLPFFYNEQVDVADERLRYRCSIDKSQFAEGVYSVRFFVFPKRRLLRCTHSLFVNRSTPTQVEVGNVA